MSGKMSLPWHSGGRIGSPSQEGPLSLGPAQGHEQEAQEGGWDSGLKNGIHLLAL